MTHQPPAHSERYDEALLWAAQLHRNQTRKGKGVPYISHLIAVSSLVWEDGGSENEAIAGLLHDAIEDAGQTHGSIAERFGEEVAGIVRDCTDTQWPVAQGAPKEPWLLRKTRYVAGLEHKSDGSLRVTAADKAHNARDMVLDARLDPHSWERFNAGLDGSAWYLLRIHQTLSHRLPGSRSNELLGEAVKEILASEAYRRLVPAGIAPAVWAAGYEERVKRPSLEPTAPIPASDS
ncbi:bifunctional (p)ppGpp synthetase/guanosine-3',5'-bis(diphosphate) 3'-pyrophosphohydrolase [Synechococcus sp. CBW1002]|jgi:(p)ppGpp synthase/HD superfamily hydrolase|uniref:HD domain-containing protein n=1 Tax=unclassified Synechococcus TaxID=2626047 RepID=UPI0018CE1ABC|nr:MULTISPECIES: HD domain-containing protein [unclassified Synechococcus]QPN58949.1 bifunctional (p)ppGpp synthetase/guanosine-3',5'-bis(diphosphate) 3'-pyrophosphohydrolase [Synechococcus sp. CBW1002]QPN65654.1 bifunctional (p)ppGpp synthetase/guanosine-3',5'-bis(diphosphate) 3'-pyrophosphohydrolase [Synechococcus sp. CBW1006]